MDKEMNSMNKHKTFVILEKHEPIPPGYQKTSCHLIFDAKFDRRKKYCLVAEGHRAPEIPQNDIYSGVVSIETVRLAFMLAAMNKLNVFAANIPIVLLYGKTKEKIYVIAGEEFRQEKGKEMLIDKGLYG